MSEFQQYAESEIERLQQANADIDKEEPTVESLVLKATNSGEIYAWTHALKVYINMKGE